MCHDKNFLRLLWDKIDQSTIKCVAVQTGAPGMTTIAPYDIESETRPRYITERMNEYSRREHHAEVEHDPSGESSEEELKGFCRRVLDLTHGM